MEELILSLIIIFILATIVPFIARKLKMPVIVLEILTGIILGVSFFNIVPEHTTIDFFAAFGLTYLMFLAGLEMDVRKIRKYLSKTIFVALFSITVPFLAGVLISNYVGVHPLFLGTIFSTTSLGIILPLVKELKYESSYLHILLTSVLLIDIVSMFLLAFSLSFISGSLSASFFYSLTAVVALFILPWIFSRKNIQWRVERWITEKVRFDSDVRFSFALIFILAAITEVFGFHSIIGAFIAGLIITEITPKASEIEEKLISFGYGFFIPLFFIIMGSKVNLPGLFNNLNNIKLLAVVVIVGIGAKVSGVGLMTKLKKYTWRESLAMGFFHSARLSLIVAAVEIGRRMEIIDQNLFSAFVILAILSAIIGPSVGKALLGKGRQKRKVIKKKFMKTNIETF